MQILIINIHQSKKRMLYALFFERCNHEFQTKERFGLAALISLIADVVSAFVKCGAEFPLPPRSPIDMFNAACGPESLIRAADQTKLLA